MVELPAQLSQVLATFFLGGVGLWFTHNYRRQLKVKLADRTFDAYARLWEVTRLIAPDGPPVDVEQRTALAKEMDDWYFQEGGGLLLEPKTRKLFFALKWNLEAEPPNVQPRMLADKLRPLPAHEAELVLSCACIRYASLLRSQLKADLAVYSGAARKHLGHWRQDERQLMHDCGISLGFKLRRRRVKGPCVCGRCENPEPSRAQRYRFQAATE